jgi:UPF0148 protein
LSEGSIKKMGELLRQGARMLSDTCPECGTPLFQLSGGDVICPMCNRPVRYVKGDADLQTEAHRERLEGSLRRKIDEIQKRLDEEDDPAAMVELTDTLMKLMEALDRAKKLGA